MSESRVTIVDVAKAAGVSLKTVSRVINREPYVRPALAAKVRGVIDRLGYVPNTAARSLAGARSFMIAALYNNPSPHYIHELQIGAMQACRAAGYHLIVEQIAQGEALDVAAVDDMLRSVRLDGVILSPPVTDCAPILERLDAHGIPFVRLSPLTVPDRSPAIYSNDAEGAGAVARHLWALGHRRIGFIAGPKDHLASRLRYEGFTDALAACGLAHTAVHVIEADFSFASGMTAGIALLAAEPQVTAIFAANDDMAAGVVAAAARLDIRIPEDLSLVGFDDSPVATLVWPPITTVHQPIAAMAMAAARLLIERGDASLAAGKSFDVELIERKSTGVSPDIIRDRV